MLPNGTTAEMESAIAPIRDYVSSVPGVQASFVPGHYPDLYSRYKIYKNTMPIGGNNAVGNRLLDAKALSDETRLREAIKVATPPGTVANLNFVAGPGTWDAQPAGGSDSVTPAWRKSYIEYGQYLVDP